MYAHNLSVNFSFTINDINCAKSDSETDKYEYNSPIFISYFKTFCAYLKPFNKMVTLYVHDCKNVKSTLDTTINSCANKV